MSTNRLRYEKARRRLAAVTFLSNISLDGNFKDPQVAQVVDKPKSDNLTDIATKSVGINKDKGVIQQNSIKGRSKAAQASPAHRVASDNHSISSDSEHTVTPVKLVNTGIRER